MTLKTNKYWFYLQPEEVKQNYIANVNRQQIYESWRTSVSVYDHVLINNLYSDAWFILFVILAIVIKFFIIKKSNFVNDKKNRNLEYEYHLINFMYCSFIIAAIFFRNIVLWIVVILATIWYLLYLYREQIAIFIQQLKEDKSMNLDMSQIQIEEEKELLALQDLKDDEILNINIWLYSKMWTKVTKSILYRYISIFYNKFFYKLNYLLYWILILWFSYIAFLLIWLYTMWSLEWLIKLL